MCIAFTLCYAVLMQEHSTSANLVLATLETLLKFLNWIPLGYIFETDLIDSLIKKVSYYLLYYIVP